METAAMSCTLRKAWRRRRPELADAIADKCGGTAAVFSGSDGGYAYCLIARQGDLRKLGRDMTAALHGRGGGKPLCQQGRVQAAKEEIEAFFRRQTVNLVVR